MELQRPRTAFSRVRVLGLCGNLCSSKASGKDPFWECFLNVLLLVIAHYDMNRGGPSFDVTLGPNGVCVHVSEARCQHKRLQPLGSRRPWHVKYLLRID